MYLAQTSILSRLFPTLDRRGVFHLTICTVPLSSLQDCNILCNKTSRTCSNNDSLVQAAEQQTAIHSLSTCSATSTYIVHAIYWLDLVGLEGTTTYYSRWKLFVAIATNKVSAALQVYVCVSLIAWLFLRTGVLVLPFQCKVVLQLVFARLSSDRFAMICSHLLLSA